MWPVSLETAAWVGLLNGSPFHISDETPDVPMVMSNSPSRVNLVMVCMPSSTQ